MGANRPDRSHVGVLVSWIGRHDINGLGSTSLGPLADCIAAINPDHLHLLYNYPSAEVEPYLTWLKSDFQGTMTAVHVPLSSPVNFGEIYQAADKQLEQVSGKYPSPIFILLSPGTPAMQAVWILLGKTRYPAIFYQASIEEGVRQADIPFEISAEYLPRMTPVDPFQAPINAAFDDIVTQNPQMLKLKAQASHLAQFNLPILINGETGTGKELFATAIHNASPRHTGPFVPVNCGAIPPELVDSTLFGHVKGAFTGAVKDKPGVFQQADGGTLFLDEFGELPLDAQVRLLRVLQSGEVFPVGSATATKVDVRIITATHRDLLQRVAVGQFREDLFYRVAVGLLHLPPLRDRAGDLPLLVDSLLQQIYRQQLPQQENQRKVSVGGKNLLSRHPWRGNIRELYSTLLRAAMWATGDSISKAAIESALFQIPEPQSGILGRNMDKSFNIQDVMGEVAQHYIRRALDDAQGNKTQAAEKLGLGSYQTLKGWMDKYNVH